MCFSPNPPLINVIDGLEPEMISLGKMLKLLDDVKMSRVKRRKQFSRDKIDWIINCGVFVSVFFFVVVCPVVDLVLSF